MDPSQEEAAMLVDESKKSCAMCGTSKTPLWRSGPAGPKSLCNACGIKHRKRKVLMCKNPDKKKSTVINPAAAAAAAAAIPSTSTVTSSKTKPRLEKSSSTNLQQSVKAGLAAFGKDMALLQRQRSLRRQRSEEEEAAVLLMSLSCGSVFA